jgi:hypothetical protein
MQDLHGLFELIRALTALLETNPVLGLQVNFISQLELAGSEGFANHFVDMVLTNHAGGMGGMGGMVGF